MLFDERVPEGESAGGVVGRLLRRPLPPIPSLREHVPKQPKRAATYHHRRDEHGRADSVSRKEEAAGNTDDNAWPKANPESGHE